MHSTGSCTTALVVNSYVSTQYEQGTWGHFFIIYAVKRPEKWDHKPMVSLGQNDGMLQTPLHIELVCLQLTDGVISPIAENAA